jgi:hypothetical protein
MNLKDWRIANRSTKRAFVKLLAEKGQIKVTPRTIHNWETGFSMPSLAKAEAIRKVTGGKVKPETFMRGVEWNRRGRTKVEIVLTVR